MKTLRFYVLALFCLGGSVLMAQKQCIDMLSVSQSNSFWVVGGKSSDTINVTVYPNNTNGDSLVIEILPGRFAIIDTSSVDYDPDFANYYSVDFLKNNWDHDTYFAPLSGSMSIGDRYVQTSATSAGRDYLNDGTTFWLFDLNLHTTYYQNLNSDNSLFSELLGYTRRTQYPNTPILILDNSSNHYQYTCVVDATEEVEGLVADNEYLKYFQVDGSGAVCNIALSACAGNILINGVVHANPGDGSLVSIEPASSEEGVSIVTEFSNEILLSLEANQNLPSSHYLSSEAGALDPVFLLGETFVGYHSVGMEDVLNLISCNLPIELSYFKGTETDCETILSWGTTVESNFSHFEVEKSADGVVFNMMGRINGENDGGTADYNYIDTQVGAVTYYRLKQVDLDDSVEYSDIVIVQADCASGVSAPEVFPNPVKNTLSIRFNSNVGNETVVINIKDNLGRTVVTKTAEVFPGANTVEVSVKNLSQVTYYVTIEGNNGWFTKPVPFVKFD